MAEFKKIVVVPPVKLPAHLDRAAKPYMGYDFSKPSVVLYSRDGKGNGIVHEYAGGHFNLEMSETGRDSLKILGLFIGDTPGIFIFEGVVRYVGGRGGFYEDDDPDVSLVGEDRELTAEEWDAVHNDLGLWDDADWLTPEARAEMEAFEEEEKQRREAEQKKKDEQQWAEYHRRHGEGPE